MKSGRWSVLPTLLVVGALAVSACGGSPEEAASPAGPESTVDCGGKQDLHAAGSAAQQNAIAQFGYAYGRACPGQTLNYTANGSSAGVDDFLAAETDFAGTDVALDPAKGQPERAAERCGSPAWHLPTVFGPIAVTFHISGVGALNLDGPTVAKIFNGTIGTWDNPAIKALNAGVALPSTPIHVVYRSDKSGLTANFQRYLENASEGAWYAADGEMFNGGVGEGAAGNNGTSAALQNTDGSISYSEWSFAAGKQLPMAQIIATAGDRPVSISAESVGKTIAGARFAAGSGHGNDLVLDMSSLYKPSTPGAYPIVSATYQIVCSKYADVATATAVRAFLQAAVGPGQDGLDQYGSIPLPEAFAAKVLAAVNAVS
ncbi:phosphate-binding protein PstS [Mycobacterium novum]|uniref:Phosphate-binding protein n=1 Tax=Mycobacterium novum TaxID=2492438 RepID=A0A7I7JRS8_9MYCO|nr:phosphate-binding protein PstS [Mycobacterium novum]